MRIYDTASFIEKARIVHDSSYDYSKVKYLKSSQKVKIICPKHGVFMQTPNNHLAGQGCMQCGFVTRSSVHFSNTESFIESAKIPHNKKYKYDQTIYLHSEKPVVILCPKHGEFSQKPFKHLQGQGCPKCRNSKGQDAIERFLLDSNVKYKTEVRFDDCKNKRSLPFDFAIYKGNALIGLIEFQGQQHFLAAPHFGGVKQLVYIQKNDQIKRDYCISKDIPLLEIKFTNLRTIKKILSNFLIRCQYQY